MKLTGLQNVVHNTLIPLLRRTHGRVAGAGAFRDYSSANYPDTKWSARLTWQKNATSATSTQISCNPEGVLFVRP